LFKIRWRKEHDEELWEVELRNDVKEKGLAAKARRMLIVSVFMFMFKNSTIAPQNSASTLKGENDDQERRR